MALIERALSEFINDFGEKTVYGMLSEFVCNNKEVEEFIRNKAIIHETRGLAKTVLVFDTDAGGICAFYAISIKSLIISSDINSRLKKKYFGSAQTSGNIIPAILIGQLGKNDAVKSKLSGSDLMDLIFRYIAEMSKLTPSMICYVEHDGSDALIKYYESHGFVYFRRQEEEIEKSLFCHIIKTKTVLEKIEIRND